MCDTYSNVSIKNLERSKRAETGSMMIMILGPEQKVPRQFKKFLSLGQNKEALIGFIFQHLKAVEGLSPALEDMELFLSHRKLCHQVSTTSQGEILIKEYTELYSDHVITKKQIHDYFFTLNMPLQFMSMYGGPEVSQHISK